MTKEPRSTLKQALKVSLVDLDTSAGFLPLIADRANQVQKSMIFQVDYIVVPSNYVVREINEIQIDPQTAVPRLDRAFTHIPESLKVDRVCCLTRNMLLFEENGKTYYNYMSGPLPSDDHTTIISTYDLRTYSAEADIDFAAAILRICLGQVAISLFNGLGYHDVTKGCLFDFCENRHDVVEMLRMDSFNHVDCRKKITDVKFLESIDSLFKIRRI